MGTKADKTPRKEAIMSTITYSRSQLGDAASGSQADKTERKGFWRRLFDGMIASQQRRADREIAAYFSKRGGVLTDDMEREMTQHLAGNRRRSV